MTTENRKSFEVLTADPNSQARRGLLNTPHGKVQTPVFMPVGTAGAVKGVTPDFYYEHVRAGKGTFTDEIRDSGFEMEKEIPLLKDQYFRVFKER